MTKEQGRQLKAMTDSAQQAPDLRPLILAVLKANDEQAKRRQENLRAWAEETG